MAEEKPERCSQRIRVDMDEWERCSHKAVTKIGDSWYCKECAKFQQAHLDKRERAILQGVVITPYGETIRPESPYESPDAAISKNGNIIHYLCNGWVDLKTVSEHHSAFYCRGCGLRVVIPNRACSTWAKLRAYVTSFKLAKKRKP